MLFRSASLRGIRSSSLEQQAELLRAAGPLERNLRRVQAVQQRLGLVGSQAPLPRVDPGPIREAIR